MDSFIKYNWREIEDTLIRHLSFFGKHVKLSEVFNSVNDGKTIELNDYIWERLENTTSNTVKKGQFNKIPKKMSWRRLFIKMLFGRQTPKPIIISYGIDKYYLLDGNKRLVINKILGKRPKVIFATL